MRAASSLCLLWASASSSLLAAPRRAPRLVLLNTALLLPLLYITYPVYRHFATDPFGELHSL